MFVSFVSSSLISFSSNSQSQQAGQYQRHVVGLSQLLDGNNNTGGGTSDSTNQQVDLNALLLRLDDIQVTLILLTQLFF